MERQRERQGDGQGTGLAASQRTGFRSRYAAQPRAVRWPLLALSALLCLAIFALLLKALAPRTVETVTRDVIAAFDVTLPEPQPEPPAPQNRSEPDEGAQGNPGKEAVAAQVTAPPAKLPPKEPEPVPPAASTGDASQSGARESGEGTGAAGEGAGTGSGNEGRGRGGIAITKPVHISGEINNARDYPVPPGGRAARRGSEVIVRVIVGVNGRARNCSIYRASPDPEADRITCQLVVERLGFRPAQDAQGNPVDAPFYWRQRWF